MPDSYWVEIAIAVPGGEVDTLVECLCDLAPGGLAVEEPFAILGPDEGVRREPWRPTVLKLYLPSDETLPERRRRLDGLLAGLPFQPERVERRLREEDWAQSWKEFFQIDHVGRRLVIRPTWRPYTPGPDELVLDLDPGMAFGTGQHPTTRLCLMALEELIAADPPLDTPAPRQPILDVIDLGCGSGILSLAAARLGCRSVLALDIGPLAVEATRANARLNHVEAIIDAERGSLGPAWPLLDPAGERADLIVANINATTICDLAEPIAAALRPGGLLLASGIIDERLDEVLVALAASGLQTGRLFADGDWRALIARSASPEGSAHASASLLRRRPARRCLHR